MAEAGTFYPTPFAQGRFRFAFMGQYTEPSWKRGKKFVMKKLKESYTWNPSDWATSVKIHEKAAELAQGFNAFSGTRYPVRFTKVSVFKVTCQGADPNATARLGESVIVEDYIEGNFKKWCNNYGSISPESESLPAFMHWSWVHTGGELMVADLQGVWKQDGFVLTDPVIMSLNNSYGPTDTGTEGMVMFFYKHQCNSYCQHLPKPATNDFVSYIPRYQLATCLSNLQQLQGATTYRVDLNFGPETRQIVASVLRGVAARNQYK